ncbi:MAG TPA: hypothetical protein VMU29_10435 [Smithella sp.]|nr:hypothetical protein [Smithella sp.]
MNNDVVLGTVGSLLAMSIGWFSREIYEKIIQPIVDKISYRNALIEGEWQTRLIFQDSSFNVIQIKLTRHGYLVKGNARCVEGYASGNEFEFKGEFTPPLLTIRYRDLAPHNTEQGAAALLLSKNGNEFKGQLVYSDDVDDGIYTTEIIMNRVTSRFAWK